jgi:chemotaxis response regulator CheB
MPREAVKLNAVEEVLPLDRIAGAIVNSVMRGAKRGKMLA